MRVRQRTSTTSRAIVVAMVGLAFLIRPLAAEERPDYAAFGEGKFLRYLNAEAGGIRAVPRIGLSFGGAADPRGDRFRLDRHRRRRALYPQSRPAAGAGRRAADLYQLRPRHDRPMGDDPGHAGRAGGRQRLHRADAGAGGERGALPGQCPQLHAPRRPLRHCHGRRRLRPRGRSARPVDPGEEPAAARHRRRWAAPARLHPRGGGRPCRTDAREYARRFPLPEAGAPA